MIKNQIPLLTIQHSNPLKKVKGISFNWNLIVPFLFGIWKNFYMEVKRVEHLVSPYQLWCPKYFQFGSGLILSGVPCLVMSFLLEINSATLATMVLVVVIYLSLKWGFRTNERHSKLSNISIGRLPGPRRRSSTFDWKCLLDIKGWGTASKYISQAE